MPLIRRIPKRGFTATPKPRYEIVALERLSRFPAGSEVTPETLFKAGLIDRARRLVKILGDGELSHALTVKAHAFSKSALGKIKNSGGTAQVL